jgi:hypothetical protein
MCGNYLQQQQMAWALEERVLKRLRGRGWILGRLVPLRKKSRWRRKEGRTQKKNNQPVSVTYRKGIWIWLGQASMKAQSPLGTVGVALCQATG